MKVSELMNRLREFDLDADVYVQYCSMGFTSRV